MCYIHTCVSQRFVDISFDKVCCQKMESLVGRGRCTRFLLRLTPAR